MEDVAPNVSIFTTGKQVYKKMKHVRIVIRMALYRPFNENITNRT